MQLTFEPNKTLLVDGPASVQLVSGKAEIFGYLIKQSQRVVVREGKRLPFYVTETAIFDLSVGTSAKLYQADINTIPDSWNKPPQTALSEQKRPCTVLILGAADVGKSSFCTYLLNRLADGKRKIAVLDGDLGQSDIGPSGTVGYAVTAKPVTELYDLKLRNACFVGVTSPVSAISKTIDCLSAMLAEAAQRQVEFILVNTDGLVSGDLGVRYKTAILDTLKPDLVVAIQLKDELVPLLENTKFPLIVVEASPTLAPRTPEKRKFLREMSYVRHLRNAKLQCYPQSQVIIEPRNAIPKKQEPEKGIMLGLYARANKFLGIGVLREVNQVRKALKVQTSTTKKPYRIVMGRVIVNEKLQEVQSEP